VTEAQARLTIVEHCRLLWTRGLVAGSSGNVSARLGDGTIVVTPTQRSLRELQMHDLVRVSAEGAPLDPAQRATSELPLHLAAYCVRSDIRCVVHTHPTYCVAWSKQGTLFPLDTVGASESLGSIAFTRYARPGSKQLAALCSAAFEQPCDTIVMERHGLSSVAADLETAFLRTDLAEQTAHIEFAAMLLATAKRPGMNDEVPHFPAADLKAAAAHSPDMLATIDELHAELHRNDPDAARIRAHVENLKGVPAIVGPLERWWLDPRTQTFIADLTAAGL